MDKAYYRRELARVLDNATPYPSYRFNGRGIVICAGGERYMLNAWVAVSLLRYRGCSLPVELWYLGERERVPAMEPHFAALDVRLVDAFEVRRRRPCRRLAGWEIKPYSIINSSFREVLLLDADNVVTRDPEYLFLTEQYQDFGAVFWPDVHYFDRKNELWDVVAMNPTKVREVETGQVLVNKEVCWKALQVTMWMNEHSDYFYRHVHGDKETFNFGFRFARHLFATPPAEPAFLMKNEKELGAMLHFDFDGGRVFQHRIGAKWDFDNNVRLPECYYEKECLEFIEELKRKMEKSK